jgi:hypothetical protein
MLLLSYAGSTFLSTSSIAEASLVAPAPGTPGYSFQLMGVTGEDANGDNRYEELVAHVDIYRDGQLLGTGDLEFWWSRSSPSAYMPGVHVTVLPLEDVYFIPRAFRVMGEANWTLIQDDSALMASTTDLTGVAFELHINPLVGLLWAGVWMMIGGMVLRVLVDQGRRRMGPREPPRWHTSAPEARAPDATPTAEPTVAPESYDDRLEEELRRLEERP